MAAAPAIPKRAGLLIVLAADTSTEQSCVALLDGPTPLCELNLRPGRGHAERLLDLIDTAITTAGRTRRDVELLCVGLGPGSFTGLRVGVVTLRTLGTAMDVPVAGVSSLEALCGPWLDDKGVLVPTLDAYRGQVYAAAFRAGGGRLDRIRPDSALPPAELADWLGRIASTEPLLVFGPGLERYRAALEPMPSNVVPLPGQRPSAVQVARCVLRSQMPLAPQARHRVLPNYVRLSDAELGFRSGAEKVRP